MDESEPMDEEAPEVVCRRRESHHASNGVLCPTSSSTDSFLDNGIPPSISCGEPLTRCRGVKEGSGSDLACASSFSFFLAIDVQSRRRLDTFPIFLASGPSIFFFFGGRWLFPRKLHPASGLASSSIGA
ncbi:unnamed protein product [Linum trigynum]